MPDHDSAGATDSGDAFNLYARRDSVRRKLFEALHTVFVNLGSGTTGLLLDLSPAGATVQMAQPLLPGVRLRVEFELPDSKLGLAVAARSSGRTRTARQA